MLRMNIGWKNMWILMAIIGLVLQGCGGAGEFSANESSSMVHDGVFLDDAVEGLEYQTITQSGFTDAEGTFRYMEGETVRFFMGGIDMGEAMAQPVMTPIDLVPDATDETHPMVTNMIRFMQTLDMDGDPDNGITLPMPVMGELRGTNIHFDMDPLEFEQNPDVVMFMDALSMIDAAFEGRAMVSIDQAQSHMRGTLQRMMGQPMTASGSDNP